MKTDIEAPLEIPCIQGARLDPAGAPQIWDRPPYFDVDLDARAS
jgi:hypothetical protein